MGRHLIVQLDLHKIREHLSQEDGRAWSEEEVVDWLRDAGFAPYRDRWLVGEADLGQVQPSEVVSVDDEPVQ